MEWPWPCISGSSFDYSCLSFYTLSEILSATDTLISSLTTLNVKIDTMNTKIDTMNTNLEALVDKTPEPQAASILCSEYYTRQDLDNDTKIYGYDFYISTDRPKILDSIPKVGTPMTWDEYLVSH